MPKKIQSNPKAVEARERKEGVKKEKQEREKKAKEDALWVVCFLFYFMPILNPLFRRPTNTSSKRRTGRRVLRIRSNRN